MTNSFAALPDNFYSRVNPTPFEHPARLVHFNDNAAKLLGLESQAQDDPEFAAIFSGKTPLPGGDPVAMLYAGHQFGQYVPQLGDGRAIILGEMTNPQGEQWEIQLKGSGLTPYSRQGDGRAVLRSTIREYLCSEAMFGLGIPTTRALCIVGSDDEVYREQIETGAILTRLAPSHVRFGSFEIFYYNNEHEHIKTLADYVIRGHYPELVDEPDPYLALLHAVINRTARLMAQWQSVGFCHGVMNSDNMSILGLTLDYGPFGFMEAYDPGFVCNHSDHLGRYAYDQQPGIGLFNLSCLAQALLPIIEVEDVKAALQPYKAIYTEYFEQMMIDKLGLEKINAGARDVIGELFDRMQKHQTDFTRLFRALSDVQSENQETPATLSMLFGDNQELEQWLIAYRAQLRCNAKPDAERSHNMLLTNPKYILRNYMAQIAIDKAEKNQDYSEIDQLITLLQSPFDEHPALSHYAEEAPDWASKISVSCSS